jgi:hypothetical protein
MTIEDLLQKNRALRNVHAGKRCFIVGNGPSIKTQDLTSLRDEVTIVVSSFFRHDEARAIRPQYWVLADPLFWNKPDEYFFPLFNAALEKAVDVKLFVPTGGAQFFIKVNTGPLIDLHFLHYDPSKDIRTLIDFAGGIPRFGQNVVIVALMLAFYLGCNPIYFIGCDHDFMSITEKEYEDKRVDHFYADSNDKKCTEYLTWQQWQAAMARMNYEYEQLKQYASLWGFDVYNATPGGCFNNFPRIAYESLFSRKFSPLRGEAPSVENNDPLLLGRTAVRLMNAGEHASALVLLDEALKHNVNNRRKVDGLEYVKALCLARLGRYGQAMLFARTDYERNALNRQHSGILVKQIGRFA